MIFFGGITFFDSAPFFLCLLLALLPAVALGLCEKSLRHYGLSISIALIVLALVPVPGQLLLLGIFCVGELLVVKGYLMFRLRWGRKAHVYVCFILLTLIPILGVKLSELLPLSLFQFLGVSYLTFRVVQMVIEIYDGVIKEVNAVEFFGFLLFFPTLACGPIDRSRRFSQDWNRIRTREEYVSLIESGLWKLLLGAVYKFVLAALFYRAMGFFQAGESTLYLAGYAYCYGIYLFFDFAGYSLMAIGASYFLGVETPENFNQPFRSIDIKDFWNRWHMTLSFWFRDFLFSRFMMQSIRKKWFSVKLTGAAVGFLINMLVMGLWHGLTLHYVLYGLYHGVLLAVTEIYQKKSVFYKAHKTERWYRGMSWFITMQLVIFGFLIFSGRII